MEPACLPACFHSVNLLVFSVVFVLPRASDDATQRHATPRRAGTGRDAVCRNLKLNSTTFIQVTNDMRKRCAVS